MSSKKTLITEAERKVFMKLANLAPVGLFDDLRMEEAEREEKIKNLLETKKLTEMEVGMEDEEEDEFGEEGEGDEVPELDGAPEMEDEMDPMEAELNIDPEDAGKIASIVAGALKRATEEIAGEMNLPLEAETEDEGGEEELEFGDEEPEVEVPVDTGEEGEDEFGEEEEDEDVNKQVMAEVFRRVVARLSGNK